MNLYVKLYFSNWRINCFFGDMRIGIIFMTVHVLEHTLAKYEVVSQHIIYLSG